MYLYFMGSVQHSCSIIVMKLKETTTAIFNMYPFDVYAFRTHPLLTKASLSQIIQM